MSESLVAYWVAWSRVSGVGSVRARTLEDRFSNLRVAWEADSFQLKAAGVGDRMVGEVIRQRRGIDPDREMEKLLAAGIGACALPDAAYPSRLREVRNPPMVLYSRGERTAADELAVAIVGTRRASTYGRQMAERIAAGLARNGVTVVSGLARGIDVTAHRAALDAGGRSLAVLGSGVDQVYPWENRGVADRLMESGALLSEYAPGTKPDARNFPPRNRIITGLSLGLVVVEADTNSGALQSNLLHRAGNASCYVANAGAYSMQRAA